MFNTAASRARDSNGPIKNQSLAPPRTPLLSNLSNLAQRVGILGGTFDPVHDGHIGAALAPMERHNLDMVILLPAGRHPLKHHAPCSSSKKRLDDLIAAARRIPQLYVSDFEINKCPPYLTIDTLLYIKAKNPQSKLYFLLGMDNVLKMSEWTRMNEYRATVEFIPIGRNGLALEQCNGIEQSLHEELMRNYVDLAMNISSTEIRLMHSKICMETQSRAWLL